MFTLLPIEKFTTVFALITAMSATDLFVSLYASVPISLVIAFLLITICAYLVVVVAMHRQPDFFLQRRDVKMLALSLALTLVPFVLFYAWLYFVPDAEALARRAIGRFSILASTATHWLILSALFTMIFMHRREKYG